MSTASARSLPRRALTRIRPAATRLLRSTPLLWDAMAILRPMHAPRVVRPHTALVIEGFPRSGNSYGRAAFEIANGTELHLAHHLHAGAHVRRAVRLGRPTVLLVRPPRDAVLSVLIFYPRLRPADAVRDYIAFHRTALAVADRTVVASFDRVVSDFGGVLEDVNLRFGTRLRRYERTPQNEEAARARVEELARLRAKGALREEQVARPSAERARAKAVLAATLDEPEVAALMSHAHVLYDRLRDVERAQRARRDIAPAPSGGRDAG